MNNSKITPKINYPNVPRVKFVKKAGLWVKTTFETDTKGNVKQVQEWFVNKEDCGL